MQQLVVYRYTGYVHCSRPGATQEPAGPQPAVDFHRYGGVARARRGAHCTCCAPAAAPPAPAGHLLALHISSSLPGMNVFSSAARRAAPAPAAVPRFPCPDAPAPAAADALCLNMPTQPAASPALPCPAPPALPTPSCLNPPPPPPTHTQLLQAQVPHGSGLRRGGAVQGLLHVPAPGGLPADGLAVAAGASSPLHEHTAARCP
jgi:hypothetical protein